MKQDESVQRQFEECLKEAIETKTDKHFVLGVTLTKGKTIAANKIDRVVHECLPSCWEFIWNNDLGANIHLSNDYYFLHHPLPDEVEDIYLQLLPDHIPSFTDNSQGGTVSNLEYKHIEPTLKRHTEAMAKYPPCDEYWFVIREGNYYAGTFDSVVIDTPIQSTFDKVFLLRTQHNELMELK